MTKLLKKNIRKEKQMFNPKVKTVFSVDYKEIEALIDEHYGEKAGFKDSYELPCLEERGSGNGEDWEISVRKEVISEYDQEYLTPDEKGKYRQWSTRTFMTDLCNKDIIPPGTYLIDISW
jgi:hypothetical protein